MSYPQAVSVPAGSRLFCLVQGIYINYAKLGFLFPFPEIRRKKSYMILSKFYLTAGGLTCKWDKPKIIDRKLLSRNPVTPQITS